jgi:hypothetical protein
VAYRALVVDDVVERGARTELCQEAALGLDGPAARFDAAAPATAASSGSTRR